ncbi:MAG: hypothetical protein ABI761_13200 [Saprospiraceae bacterium]
MDKTLVSLLMVTIIENWSKITGIVRGESPHPKITGFIQLKVTLEKSQAVKEFPNLALSDSGKEILVNIPVEFPMKFKKGDKFQSTVRKVFGQEYFIKMK